MRKSIRCHCMRENGNPFEVQYAYEFVFLWTFTLEASHFIQRLDVTNFGEPTETKRYKI